MFSSASHPITEDEVGATAQESSDMQRFGFASQERSPMALLGTGLIAALLRLLLRNRF